MTVSFARLPCPESPVRGVDPRWKLAALVLATACVAALHSWPATLLALTLALGLAGLARLPPAWLAARLGTVGLVLVPFAVSLPFLVGSPEPLLAWGWLHVSAEGVAAAAALCARALAVVTLMLVLVTTAPPDATLKAAHALRVPGLLVQLLLLTYRYIDVVTAELVQMRVAVRTRGYRNRPTWHSYRTIGNVTGTLLVRGVERADRVGQAMRCRGFDGRFRSLTDFRTTWRDVVFFVAVTGLFGGLLAWDRFVP
jgi:cobalt/nickel transport system permease protein